MPDCGEGESPCAANVQRRGQAASGVSAFEPEELAAFCERVWENGARLYRGLPWRNLDDAYAVLVSEVMLQQTQVARVRTFWERFMALFPTPDALAAADTSLLLEQWQGLGYNRRALMLKRAAEACAQYHGGTLPESYDELLALPGVGPATAAGVVAFAYNRPAVYLETNVRTVFLHELFPGEEGVPDRLIRPLVEQTCPADNPRGWYYALLDWGAHIKRTEPNPSRRSAHHTRQSAFEGSRRQKRAELLRAVLEEPGIGEEALFARLDAFERAAGRGGADAAEFSSVLADLLAEGFFRREGSGFVA